MFRRNTVFCIALAVAAFHTGCEPGWLNRLELIRPAADVSDVVGDLELSDDVTAILSLRVIAPAAAPARKTLTAPAEAANLGTNGDEGDATSVGVLIESAFIIVEDIKLKRDSDCEGGDAGTNGDEDQDDGDPEGCHEEIHLLGPFLVDLVNETVENLGHGDAPTNGMDGSSTGVSLTLDDEDVDGEADAGLLDADDEDATPHYLFDALALPPGIYRKIKFSVKRLKGARYGLEDHPMNGRSVLVRGTIDEIPFVYSSAKTEQLHFKSREGLLVENGFIAKFLLTVELADWFAGVDLVDAEVSDDGDVYIAQNANRRYFWHIRRQFRERMRFGHDNHHGAHRDGDQHHADMDEVAEQEDDQ